MENEFVPYDQALALKELGFDESCFGFYNDMENNKPMGGNFPCDGRNSAPLYQQAFRFFREKYNLTWEHQFDDSNISLYVGEIAYPDNNLDFFKIIEVECDGYNKAYEQAQLECLKRLIEIVKNQKL
jgi:hypothetical protein